MGKFLFFEAGSKVFLSVPSGEDGHVEDGPIGKLDPEIVQ
jgi:hypothetical protein